MKRPARSKLRRPLRRTRKLLRCGQGVEARGMAHSRVCDQGRGNWRAQGGVCARLADARCMQDRGDLRCRIDQYGACYVCADTVIVVCIVRPYGKANCKKK